MLKLQWCYCSRHWMYFIFTWFLKIKKRNISLVVSVALIKANTPWHQMENKETAISQNVRFTLFLKNPMSPKSRSGLFTVITVMIYRNASLVLAFPDHLNLCRKHRQPILPKLWVFWLFFFFIL